MPQRQAGVWLIRWRKSSFQLSVESNCGYTGFALPCSVIGLEKYCLSLNHSNAETNPKTRSLTFSLASGSLLLFSTFLLPSWNILLPIDWWLWLLQLVVVEQHSIEKPSTEVENLGRELKVKTRTVNKGEFKMFKSHC